MEFGGVTSSWRDDTKEGKEREGGVVVVDSEDCIAESVVVLKRGRRKLSL